MKGSEAKEEKPQLAQEGMWVFSFHGNLLEGFFTGKTNLSFKMDSTVREESFHSN